MYKKLYNLSIKHLIKIRSHIGHKQNSLNLKVNSYIYGIRHNINIFNIEKFWKLYRYLFYNLVENVSKRHSFFLVGTNKNLPIDLIMFKFINNYLSTDLKTKFKIESREDKKKNEQEKKQNKNINTFDLYNKNKKKVSINYWTKQVEKYNNFAIKENKNSFYSEKKNKKVILNQNYKDFYIKVRQFLDINCES